MNIEIIIGPMYSGKSTELMRRCMRYKAVGCNVLVINHQIDTRCDNEISTHNHYKMEALKVPKLCNISHDVLYNNHHVIAIDEAQFFDDLKEFVMKHENMLNTTLIISGLDGDYKKDKFGQTLDIIPYSNSVTKLNSLCMICCNGNLAPFTKRICAVEEQIHVGKSESYKSVCRKCFAS